VPDSRILALEYLAEHQVMTLATGSGTQIWAAAVFYVNQDFSLFFLSSGHTRHARHLTVNPWAAATIQEDYDEWQKIKGIQLEGRVSLLSGTAQKMAIQVYANKYPFLGQATGALAAALKKVNWYRITPSRLYYIDNSQGFGHREEVLLTI
jgi:uncharacterized protein YhbP (UPF0306 family)